MIYKLKVLYARPPMLLIYRPCFLLAQASFLPAPQAYTLVATSRSAWRTEKARSKKLSVSKPEEQAL